MPLRACILQSLRRVPATVHLHDLAHHVSAHRRIIERTSGPFDTTVSMLGVSNNALCRGKINGPLRALRVELVI
jgi:hypothetical protein